LEAKPLVSVCMITYNHEMFIREAIEGVLMQEVEFEVEFIIADDSSPDFTEEIVKDLIKNHPKGHWIKYSKHPKNKGMMGNFIWALAQCAGKYIALCEGDDYWIDPLKLEKQVNFLEKNIEYIGTYHDCKILNEEGKLVDDFITKKNFHSDRSGLFDIAVYGNFIHTPSFVFKNQYKILPNYFAGLEVGDFFLYLYLAQFGDFKSLRFSGAVYRYGVGIFSGSSGEIMRKKFKKSILLASIYQPVIVKNILRLRFHQDKLYRTDKKVYSPVNFKNLSSLIGHINFINFLKGVIKLIIGTEKRRVFGS
jgi:glycosyltransferase involved in cell wall biosynthesis